MTALETEWSALKVYAIGTILLGDINVHHKRWLRWSAWNSAEVGTLMELCGRAGLRQMVKGPTRGEYLIDLVITDVEQITCKILQKMADHAVIWAQLKVRVPTCTANKRLVWQFAKADWDGLREHLQQENWHRLQSMDADAAAVEVTGMILRYAEECIPKRLLRDRKSSHPWVNDRILDLVQRKRAAEGTNDECRLRAEYNAGVREEYLRYVAREREHLKSMPKSSKGWWSRARKLLRQQGQTCSIPALRGRNGEWLMEASDKANAFAEAFSAK